MSSGEYEGFLDEVWTLSKGKPFYAWQLAEFGQKRLLNDVLRKMVEENILEKKMVCGRVHFTWLRRIE